MQEKINSKPPEIKNGIITATEREAGPFIKGLSLSLERAEESPFKIYTGNGIALIISGIGKANAAMAALYLIEKYRPGRVYNIGVAGAASGKIEVGEIFHISKVAEPDRPRLSDGKTRILTPLVLEGFKTASLATQDRVILTAEERREASEYAELVDMEAASIIQACKLYGTRCCIFKIVSDTPEHDDTEMIQKNIKLVTESMFRFFVKSVLDRE